jgi:hypothetical protein
MKMILTTEARRHGGAFDGPRERCYRNLKNEIVIQPNGAVVRARLRVSVPPWFNCMEVSR